MTDSLHQLIEDSTCWHLRADHDPECCDGPSDLGCACDPCFYGRHRLAGLLAKAVCSLERIAEGDDNDDVELAITTLEEMTSGCPSLEI